jgi:hypothetical protein
MRDLRSGACGLSASDVTRGLTARGLLGVDGERIMVAPDQAALLIEDQRLVYLEVLGKRRERERLAETAEQSRARFL